MFLISLLIKTNMFILGKIWTLINRDRHGPRKAGSVWGSQTESLWAKNSAWTKLTTSGWHGALPRRTRVAQKWCKHIRDVLASILGNAGLWGLHPMPPRSGKNMGGWTAELENKEGTVCTPQLVSLNWPKARPGFSLGSCLCPSLLINIFSAYKFQVGKAESTKHIHFVTNFSGAGSK